jgi:hypothetical protein
MCYRPDGPYVQEMKKSLDLVGIESYVCLFGQPYPSGQDLISVVDFEKPIVHEFSEESFNTFVGYLEALDARMIWATSSAQVGCQDPRAAMILGLARTARSELSAKLFTVEIDSRTPVSTATEALVSILIRVQTIEPDALSMDPDWEYAIVDSQVLVPRLHWQTMSEAFAEDKVDKHLWKQLALKTPGLLNTMLWNDLDPQSPGWGQVVVQTKAIGLNFRVCLLSLSTKLQC